MLKLTDTTPPTTPPSTWTSQQKQMPYPNHISQRHRAAIGPMMGKVSPSNPVEWTRKSPFGYASQVYRVLQAAV
jgi:hypothetical protein